MKKIILLIISTIALASCSKDNTGSLPEPDNNKVTFSYSNFDQTDGVATFELGESGNNLYIALEHIDGTSVNGFIDVQLGDYKGPGTYNFGDNVSVRAMQNNVTGYWNSYFYENDEVQYATGIVKVKSLNNDRIVAEIDGKLYHTDENGNRSETTVKASIDHFR
ncbi:hypothetical protein ACFQZX_05835 [Mucilaginibacter litoreus]|uniref:Lipoprotein n=1 Tax=Mucilaginibacter litoreus TaxID=1048221 RepID=A0ABW3AQ07_9SPHI